MRPLPRHPPRVPLCQLEQVEAAASLAVRQRTAEPWSGDLSKTANHNRHIPLCRQMRGPPRLLPDFYIHYRHISDMQKLQSWGAKDPSLLACSHCHTSTTAAVRKWLRRSCSPDRPLWPARPLDTSLLLRLPASRVSETVRIIPGNYGQMGVTGCCTAARLPRPLGAGTSGATALPKISCGPSPQDTTTAGSCPSAWSAAVFSRRHPRRTTTVCVSERQPVDRTAQQVNMPVNARHMRVYWPVRGHRRS